MASKTDPDIFKSEADHSDYGLCGCGNSYKTAGGIIKGTQIKDD